MNRKVQDEPGGAQFSPVRPGPQGPLEGFDSGAKIDIEIRTSLKRSEAILFQIAIKSNNTPQYYT